MSPALIGSPYHESARDVRIRPVYQSNSQHDTNPNKTPNPPDALEVYFRSHRGRDVATWYGRGERGRYRYFSDNAGTAHFSAIVERRDVPNDILKLCGERVK